MRKEVDVPLGKASANLASSFETAAKSPYMYSYRAQASHSGLAFSAGIFSAERSNNARASTASAYVSR
jgi:hypothetical protein